MGVVREMAGGHGQGKDFRVNGVVYPMTWNT